MTVRGTKCGKTAAQLAGCLVGILGLAGGCQTPGKDPAPQQEKAQPTHYTLEFGPEEHETPALPVKRKIWVQWHKGAAEGRRVEGFRGYDFNDDGRLDMVEVLSETGEVQTRLFDFDGDGRVDARRPAPGEKLELPGE